MAEKAMAVYDRVLTPEGDRYQFFCGLSGALACVTAVYCGDTPEQTLCAAWEKEGKKRLNYCRRCGRWVIDAMYNPDVLECVACAPFEDVPKFCKFCGTRVRKSLRRCPNCGKLMRYEGAETP